MLPHITSLPSDALVELLFVIITGRTRTTADITEIQQIGNELQRRGEEPWLELAIAGDTRPCLATTHERTQP